MIKGIVSSNRQPIIELTLFGSSNIKSAFDAVVDTGFARFLTLPINTIEELNLPSFGSEYATLADGTVELFDKFLVDVLWDAQRKTVEVYATRGAIFVGMGLIEGHTLYINAVPGGAVEIAASRA